MIKFRGVYTVTIEGEWPETEVRKHAQTVLSVEARAARVPENIRDVIQDESDDYTTVRVFKASSEVWEEEG